MSKQITIALTKGRIEKDTVKLLEKAGFDLSFMAEKGRNLIFESPDKTTKRATQKMRLWKFLLRMQD